MTPDLRAEDARAETTAGLRGSGDDRGEVGEQTTSDARVDGMAGITGPPSFPLPTRPPLPTPERLNRNALTILAVVMGVLVIAAVVLVPPPRPADDAGPGAATPPPPQASYLDQPGAGEGGVPAATRPFGAPSPAIQATLDSIAAAGSVSRLGTDAPTSMPVEALPAAPTSATAPTPLTTAPRAPSPDARAAAFRAALAAPVQGSVAAAADATISAGADEAPWPSDPTAAAPAVRATWTADAAPAAGPPTARPQFRQFLDESRRPAATAIRTSITPAPGAYTVQAGAVVPAVLLTEVNSDLPGDVLAQVTRDVFDSQTQRTLLIPKGARLLGRYHDQVGLGQNRLLLAWTRILLPDGRSVSLPGMPAQDGSGAGGVGGRVERHGRRVLGSAALLSLIGAGLQLSQPNGGYGPWGGPSAGQVVAGAAGQQLAQVMSQLMQQNMTVQPTIRLAQGTPFNVFLTADLAFPGAYDDGEAVR